MRKYSNPLSNPMRMVGPRSSLLHGTLYLRPLWVGRWQEPQFQARGWKSPSEMVEKALCPGQEALCRVLPLNAKTAPRGMGSFSAKLVFYRESIPCVAF